MFVFPVVAFLLFGGISSVVGVGCIDSLQQLQGVSTDRAGVIWSLLSAQWETRSDVYPGSLASTEPIT